MLSRLVSLVLLASVARAVYNNIVAPAVFCVQPAYYVINGLYYNPGSLYGLPYIEGPDNGMATCGFDPGSNTQLAFNTIYTMWYWLTDVNNNTITPAVTLNPGPGQTVVEFNLTEYLVNLPQRIDTPVRLKAIANVVQQNVPSNTLNSTAFYYTIPYEFIQAIWPQTTIGYQTATVSHPTVVATQTNNRCLDFSLTFASGCCPSAIMTPKPTSSSAQRLTASNTVTTATLTVAPGKRFDRRTLIEPTTTITTNIPTSTTVCKAVHVPKFVCPRYNYGPLAQIFLNYYKRLAPPNFPTLDVQCDGSSTTWTY